ncbi:hypothetical protein Q0N12_17245 [Rossellomorea marisflavi]|uniref:hypothetical protein n=1 Tax=Rossellomorea marisflavi TaxID=189381 RepID=UPI003458D563
MNTTSSSMFNSLQEWIATSFHVSSTGSYPSVNRFNDSTRRRIVRGSLFSRSICFTRDE